MNSAVQIVNVLREMSNPEVKDFKEKKYGIIADNSLGIYQRDLKEFAKKIDRHDDLALALFDTGIYEAQILCSLLFNRKHVTGELMEHWVQHFNSWEICDSFCMSFMGGASCTPEKIKHWTTLENEFQKRAGFVLIVGYHFACKNAPNEDFEGFFPILINGASDERNFVKKAVSWAIRCIGKRNKDLKSSAIELAQQIQKQDSKSAQWIAKDVLRELLKPDLKTQDHPRAIYRPK